MIGRSPDLLTLSERKALAGKVIAMQVYTPQNLAERRIEAIAGTTEECIASLATRGLDPADFEFTRLRGPFD
jgi:hypothetical protein